jgi:hypothetical protein
VCLAVRSWQGEPVSKMCIPPIRYSKLLLYRPDVCYRRETGFDLGRVRRLVTFRYLNVGPKPSDTQPKATRQQRHSELSSAFEPLYNVLCRGNSSPSLE